VLAQSILNPTHPKADMTDILTPIAPTPEQAALLACAQKMKHLQAAHPDWFALYEETLVNTARRAEIVELMHSAPTDFSLGLMHGVYAMRIELEAVTQRQFL
jgi:hypothetical protein